MSQLAVLTGDLVNSTRLAPSELDEVFRGFEESCDRIRAWDGLEQLRIARVSGDGWQVALRPAKFALRAATVLRADHISHNPDSDTRISIATGDGPSPLPHDLNAASGSAFTASGRALGKIPDWALMNFHGDPALKSAVVLLDRIISGWTANQASIVSHLLHLPAPTQILAAKALGKTPQAISKALQAAGYPAVETAITLIEGSYESQGNTATSSGGPAQ